MTRQTGAWNRLSSYRTTWWTEGLKTRVTYHSTYVVQRYEHDGRWWIELDTGDYRTVTTKRKMNQSAGQFDLPYCVHQKNHLWFVTTKAGVFPFDDRAFVFDAETGLPASVLYAMLDTKEHG